MTSHHNHTYLPMQPLEVYYIRQAGRGLGTDSSGIGPIYSIPPRIQRGHGIGNVFGSLFRWIRPILWSGAKALGRESLRTGGKILSDIAANQSSSTPSSNRDIVARHLDASRQTLIDKLEGRGRTRAASKRRLPSKKKPPSRKRQPPKKRAKLLKRDIFA